MYLGRHGFKHIVGLDEVGRGSWAGPLVACAIKLPKDKRFYKIRDSKILISIEREKMARKLMHVCKYGIGIVEVGEINQMNLHQVNLLAYKRALAGLRSKIDFVLIDGFRAPNIEYPHKAIKGGDRICASIAAASIVAKVYRDKLMAKLARKYKVWRFDSNKGYGTSFHQKMLKKLGPLEIHRMRFAPIKATLNNQ